jgi:hypothetical protein
MCLRLISCDIEVMCSNLENNFSACRDKAAYIYSSHTPHCVRLVHRAVFYWHSTICILIIWFWVWRCVRGPRKYIRTSVCTFFMNNKWFRDQRAIRSNFNSCLSFFMGCPGNSIKTSNDQRSPYDTVFTWIIKIRTLRNFLKTWFHNACYRKRK